MISENALRRRDRMRTILLIMAIATAACAAEAPAADVDADSGGAHGIYLKAVGYANGDADEGGYGKAAEYYRMAALKGHPGAQRNLAILYDLGLGVELDYAEAARLYALAAGTGDPAALVMLAHMHETGRGMSDYSRPRDLLLVRLLRELREHGMADPWELHRSGDFSQQDDAKVAAAVAARAGKEGASGWYAYGIVLETGFGGVKNVQDAVAWYEKAAGGEYAPALCRMGQLFMHGEHVPGPDHNKAFHFFTAAMERGDVASAVNAGMYHYVMKNYDRAYECYAIGADLGSVIAAERNGTMLLGEGLWDGAAEWNLRAAAMGGANANLFLFILYEAGLGGLEKDLGKAVEHLMRGMEMGSSGLPPDDMILPYLQPRFRSFMDGMDMDKSIAGYAALSAAGDAGGHVLMGICSQHGLGMARDAEKALGYFSKAFDEGHAFAAFLAGKLIDADPFFAGRRGECVEWYEKAARGGYGLAWYRLGVLYELGDLMEKSVERAIDCYGRVQQERGIAALDSAERLYTLEREKLLETVPDAGAYWK